MIKKLPRNWCIRQNTHQNVCNWFNRKYDIQSFLEGGYDYLSNRPVKDCNLVFQTKIPEGFLEITYEEFEYFILNKEHLIKTKPDDLSYLIDFLKQKQII